MSTISLPGFCMISLVVIAACADDSTTASRAMTAPSAGAVTALGPKAASGYIAYASDITGNSEIYILDQATQTAHRLTNDPLTDYQPRLSPDGRRVVWGRSTPDGGEIRMMNIDGTKEEVLVPGSAYGVKNAPSFSPDGKRVLFGTVDPNINTVHLFTVDVRTHEVTSVGDPTLHALAGVFSPDGKRIAFVHSDGMLSKIYIMNADGSDAHEIPGLCPATSSCLWPAWSPNGAYLLFSEANSQAVVGYSFAMGTTLVQALGARAPTWSPDGQRIAFLRIGGGPPAPGIYTQSFPSDGKEESQITGIGAVQGTLTWSK